MHTLEWTPSQMNPGRMVHTNTQITINMNGLCMPFVDADSEFLHFNIPVENLEWKPTALSFNTNKTFLVESVVFDRPQCILTYAHNRHMVKALVRTKQLWADPEFQRSFAGRKDSVCALLQRDNAAENHTYTDCLKSHYVTEMMTLH